MPCACIARLAPGGPRDRPHARDPAPRRAHRRARRCARAPLRARRRAPRGRRPGGRRARGARSPCAPPRRTGSSSGPTTGCCCRRPSASAAPSRPSRSRARRGAWSRCRRRSTAATSSRRSRRGSPPARRWPRRASRSTRPSSSALELPRARVAATGALVAHVMAIDALRQRAASTPATRTSPGPGLRLGRAAGASTPARARSRPASCARSPTSSPASCSLYEDAYRTLALAVNRGDAAGELGLRPGDELRLSAAVTAPRPPRLHLRSTDSTNARARELAAAGAPHGTLVTAAEQSAGRGRQGRTWIGAAGARAADARSSLRELAGLLPLRGRRSRSPTWPAPTRGSSGPTTSCSTGARSPGSSSRRARRRAGRSSGSASTSRSTWPTSRTSCAPCRDPGPPAGRRRATLAELLAALDARLAEPPARVVAALRARDALLGRPVTLGRRRGERRGHRRRRAAARARPRRRRAAAGGRRGAPGQRPG